MPKGPEGRTERFTLRLSPRLRLAIEDAAARDNRSASDWMVLALTAAVGLKPVQAPTWTADRLSAVLSEGKTPKPKSKPKKSSRLGVAR
jgi:hypothetical protein